MNEEYEQEYDQQYEPQLQRILPQSDPRVHEVILDNNLIIDELMRTLRGEIIDSVDNTVKSIGKPVVSEEAINWIVGRILPYTSKIISLSVLDPAIVNQIIYEFEEYITLELMFPEKVGVERHQRDYVKWLMVHTMVVTCHKARGGETLKKLLAQHQVTESSITQESPKKGLFGRLRL